MPEINGSNRPVNNNPVNSSQQPNPSEADHSAADVSGKSRHGQSVGKVKSESVFSRIKAFFRMGGEPKSISGRHATVVHKAKDVIPEMMPGKVEKLGLNDVAIGKELGQGQFGRVYLTTTKDTAEVADSPQTLHKNYVVKDQSLGHMTNDTEQYRREKLQMVEAEVQLQEEARGAVPVTDEAVGVDNKGFLHHRVMMEHGGTALAELTGLTDARFKAQLKINPYQPISGTALDERFCRTVTTELFQQLADIHQQGMVHRDIKPANVLIDQQGRARLADFGLGQKAADNSEPGDSNAVKYSGVAGAPSFMAPEVVTKEAYSEKVDCWSMGMMLLELLTGECSRSVYTENGGYLHFEYGRYLQLVKDVTYHPHLSPEAKNTILSLINLNPEERPSAREVLNQNFFQLTLTQNKKTHFQLQAQHREKFQELAELERSLEALEKREADNAPEKSRSRNKSRGEKVKTAEMSDLERKINVTGLKVKGLQAKMDLEDLHSEASRLEKDMPAVLGSMIKDDTDGATDVLNKYVNRATDSLEARTAVTKRDIALKKLEVNYMDQVVKWTHQKNSATEQIVRCHQKGLPLSEPLKEWMTNVNAQLEMNEAHYQLECLRVEQDYFTNHPGLLTKKQKSRAKKVPKLIDKKLEELKQLDEKR